MSETTNLNNFIDSLHKGQTQSPASSDEQFAKDLHNLSSAFSLDSDFDAALKQQFTQITVKEPIMRLKQKRKPYRQLIASVAALTLLIVTVFAVPDLRALAQTVLETLFPVSEESTREINLETLRAEESVYEEFESLEAAREAIPFSFVVPDAWLESLPEVRYRYWPQKNVLYFRYAENEREEGLLYGRVVDFFQQPLEDAASEGILGMEKGLAPEAEIHNVTFGSDDNARHAQWVKGSWTNRTGPDEDGMYPMQWDNSSNNYMFRWQDETYVYQISWIYVHRRDEDTRISGQLVLEEVISLAEIILAESR